MNTRAFGIVIGYVGGMGHFGFVCPPYLGHLNPMQALAGALRRRGHRTTLFGLPDVASMLHDPAFGFTPVAATSHPPGTLATLTAHMADPRGLKLFRILGDMARLTDALCEDLPEAIRKTGIDALIVDQLEPAGGLVADHLGLPFVSVANALLIDREPNIPPPFVDWPYDPSPAGQRRNQWGYRVADLVTSGLGRVIARHASKWGLTPRTRMEDCLSPLAQLSQTVPGFDFPRHTLPSTMHHCGPLRPPLESMALDGVRGGGRPLVFASLGTLQGGRASVFRHIAEACRQLDLDLVIAHGGRLSPEQIAALPGRPTVRDFVPQRTLLRQAALAITNGGLNTVLDALAAAVPVIAIPIAFEQGAIGARLKACGAGTAVPLTRLTAERLRPVVADILARPSFAAAARAVAAEIAAAGGVDQAAAVIEAAALKRDRVSQSRDLQGARMLAS